jgi:hypothetical protein
MMIDCTSVASMPLPRYSIEVLRGTASFSLRFQFFSFNFTDSAFLLSLDVAADEACD